MRRGRGFRLAAAAIGAAFLLAGTGCRDWLVASHMVSFGAGWLLRDVTVLTSVERECYQNGVLVDCDTLPDTLGQ